MNRWLLCGLLAALLPGPVFGQAADHPLTDRETRELVAKCRTKPLKSKGPKISLPPHWLGKNEKYRGSPSVSFSIAPDGTVHDVILKKSSGARKMDEYAMDVIKGWKYKPMPGCPGIQTTTSLTIDFMDPSQDN